MKKSYWHRASEIRLSRRRALAAAATTGVGAGALALVGCGSSEESGLEGGLGKPVDTTRDLVRGATLQSYMAREPATLDVGSSDVSTTHTFGGYYFSRLLKIKSGPGVDYGAMLPDGDLAESWDSSDGLTWTFKLRPNARMQNVPPLNGRPVDADDVLMSWQRFRAVNPKRGRYAMVESVTAPDSKTLVFKLQYPYAPFARSMADTLGFWVMPKEYAQEKLDGRNTGVGSGPWIIDRHIPSARIEMRRNPDYYIDGRPYIDRIDLPLVEETAQQRAQFLARNTYIYTPPTDDVWSLRRDVPSAVMWKSDWGTGWPVIFFGRKEVDPIWHDIRVRRALAMAVDRDRFIDVFYDVAGSKQRGLSVEMRWSNTIAVGWPEWLDPKSAAMGYPNNAPGKWYTYDPAESKKLLSAAGYANGIDANGYYFTGQSSLFMRRVEVTMDYFREIGVRLKHDPQDYYTKFIPDSVLKGSSKGVGLTPSGEFNEVDVMLYDHFMPQRNFWDPPTAVSGPEGTSVRNPANFYDQEVFDLIQKQRRTLDSQERTSIIHEIQKKLSDFMWEIPWEGEADTGYTFTHPLLMNYRVWRATPDWLLNLWIDAKKLGG
jgi:peptide/nickel transport system substrate-binding protein